ncbi:MAG: hypothetical protein H0X62_10705 [Bacteroidetes bacterium]|nr:hypothetical protein [Bacteroidota bacterium]
MPVFTIPNVQNADKSQFYKGFYLALVYLNKIPPHLLFIISGKVYSITIKGKQEGEPVQVLLKTISLKQIQCLFLQIDLPVLNLNGTSAKEAVELIMRKYSVVNSQTTCLSPLRDFFSSNLSADISKASVIFDLITELYKFKCIKNVYHLFLDKRLINNNIEIETYSVQDIYQRINQLSK